MEHVEGRAVLGEMTKVRHLSWELPTERVEASLVPSSLPLTGKGGAFAMLRGVTVQRYAVVRRELDGLMVRNEYRGHDSDGAQWLALNPEVGRALGWRLSQEGLFRWVDTAKETMVETLWWRDGTTEHQPPHFDDDVGEGWVVLASVGGRRALEERFGTLQRLIRLTRSARVDGTQIHDVATFVEDPTY
jgi:hypothetical protein